MARVNLVKGGKNETPAHFNEKFKKIDFRFTGEYRQLKQKSMIYHISVCVTFGSGTHSTRIKIVNLFILNM